MLSDYNFYGNTLENIIYPIVWRNSVANLAALSAVSLPLDGETRYVQSDDTWRQYWASDSSWHAITKISGGLANIVEDTTPQLGGNLDMNGHNIGGNTEAQLDDAVDKKHSNVSDHAQDTDQKLDDGGVNEVTVANAKDAVDKKHTQNTDTHLGTVDADININSHELDNVSGIGLGVAADANAYQKISDKYIVCKTFTSAGINACIDALGSEGGEVYLPEGEYTINSVITIDYNNTILRGAGFGTYLNATSHNGHVILISGKSSCQVRDLYIKGSAGSGYTQNLITDEGVLSPYFICFNVKVEDADNFGINWSASGAAYSLFYNVHCHNADSHGLFIYGGQYNKVAYCSATSNGAWGIGVKGTGNAIINCLSTANGSTGLYGANGTVVQACTVFNNFGEGIKILGAGAQVENNLVSFNSKQNIYVIGNDQTVVGNYVYAAGNGYVDIQLGLVIRGVVLGNTIYSYAGRSEWGIYLDRNTDYIQISSNASYGHDTGGIYLHANSDNCHVELNNLDGESGTVISDNGTNNTIINAKAKVITNNSITDHIGTMGNSTKSPTTDAPDDWVEVKIGGTAYYIPAYLAS